MQAPSLPPSSLKVLLVSSFEDYFLEQDTLPELARRGVEVVARFEARNVESYDLAKYKAEGVEMILHMHEVGPHAASWRLTEKAKLAGLPVRALSRKKASWTFLPQPLDGGPESIPKPPPAADSEKRTLRGRGSMVVAGTLADVAERVTTSRGAVLHAGLSAVDGTEAPKEVREHILRYRFDRRDAKLRDIIRLIIAHGITEYDTVLEAVEAGRQSGMFPRLLRVKGDLPKLVKSMLAHELNEAATNREAWHFSLNESDREGFQAIGLGAPAMTASSVGAKAAVQVMKDVAIEAANAAKAAGADEDTAVAAGIAAAKEKLEAFGVDPTALGFKEEEKTDMSAQVFAMTPNPQDDVNRETELAQLRAEVKELRKLREAHEALSKLVALGFMTETEAARKLFGGGAS